MNHLCSFGCGNYCNCGKQTCIYRRSCCGRQGCTQGLATAPVAASVARPRECPVPGCDDVCFSGMNYCGSAACKDMIERIRRDGHVVCHSGFCWHCKKTLGFGGCTDDKHAELFAAARRQRKVEYRNYPPRHTVVIEQPQQATREILVVHRRREPQVFVVEHPGCPAPFFAPQPCAQLFCNDPAYPGMQIARHPQMGQGLVSMEFHSRFGGGAIGVGPVMATAGFINGRFVSM